MLRTRRRDRAGSMRSAACFAVAALLCGCLYGPADEAPVRSGSETDASNAMSEPVQKRPGVPNGCTLEWSSTARDSVVYCPDIRPPSPR